VVATKVTPIALAGTAGDDKIVNTAAIEVITGGDGLDKLSFEGGTKGIRIDLSKGTLTDSSGNKETVSGIEIVIGTEFNDTIIGSGGTDYLVGGAGNDRIIAGAGEDEVYGGEGADTINAGDGSDYIVGGAGNDQINGGKGFDTLDYSDEGGAFGIDIHLGKSTGKDTWGDTDRISNVESIKGTELADKIIGNSANNWFRGGAGDDTLEGGTGDDVLWAGFGNDRVLGGNNNDVIVGGRGDDFLDGGKGVDTLDYAGEDGWRGVAVNLATGLVEDTWGSVDTVKGFEKVTGTVHADWMLGDKLANVFDAGFGDDTMAGGGGNDTFVFGAGHGMDRINDFATGDVLDLRGLGFASADDVVAMAEGHDLGVLLRTGEGSSILLVDVNIASVKDLGFIFV
jgi:Ca2+-binding RTX toxin-like protein